MTDEFSAIGKTMHSWAEELWPLCRSLTGPGTIATLNWLKRHNPEMVEHQFSTGERVFDWEIPKEWTIRDAWIEHESGKRFAEFKRNNLHVLGYAAPLDAKMDRDELLPLIYTQDDQPDLIPYVTSYYRERSGFCMSAQEKDALPAGRYHARIDSDLEDGTLSLVDMVLPGDCKEEVLFSTYICHPSMANNELSGPVLANALASYVRSLPNRRMSYRFVFVPETIGVIAFLSRHLDLLKMRLKAGFVLSCVGDERAWSHVASRKGDTLADLAITAALSTRDKATRYSFLERGSDERQYCAPGIDLPVCGFCRSKYGTFPEYHTSADDLSLVTPTGLQGSFDALRAVIDAFELGLLPRATILGEPQLGKRGLYPTLSQKGTGQTVRLRMNVLAYSDGTTSLFDMATLFDAPLREIVDEAHLLAEHGLLSFTSAEKADQP